jgi:hypothetical protein
MEDDELPTSVDQHYRRLKSLVAEFLDLSGLEARACFSRMFSEVAESPLLGVSTIGGMVGLCAYIKVVLELGVAKIGDSDVVSVSDIADFAARIAVPFVVLSIGIGILTLAWTACLILDHRKTLKFSTVMAAILVLLFLPFGWFLWSSGGNPGTSINIFFLSLAILALLPCAWLIRAGLRRPGVKTDDEVQRDLLIVLRAIADPRTLLLVFAGICISLVFSKQISVLDFDQSTIARVSSLGQPAIHVVELSKTGDAMVVTSIARLSRGWIVRRLTPTSSESDILIINSSEIACVRDLTMEEQSAIRQGRLMPIFRQCAKKADDPKRDPNAGASVSDYATRVLGCKSNTFSRGASPVVMYRFNTDEPPDLKNISAVADDHQLFIVPAEEFTGAGLPGGLGRSTEPSVSYIGKYLEKEELGKAWVLGFASVVGDPSHNLDLSARRAQFLRQNLIKSGRISAELAERIEYRGLGATFLSGMTSPSDVESDRIAIAFLCSADR